MDLGFCLIPDKLKKMPFTILLMVPELLLFCTFGINNVSSETENQFLVPLSLSLSLSLSLLLCLTTISLLHTPLRLKHAHIHTVTCIHTLTYTHTHTHTHTQTPSRLHTDIYLHIFSLTP